MENSESRKWYEKRLSPSFRDKMTIKRQHFVRIKSCNSRNYTWHNLCRVINAHKRVNDILPVGWCGRTKITVFCYDKIAEDAQDGCRHYRSHPCNKHQFGLLWSGPTDCARLGDDSIFQGVSHIVGKSKWLQRCGFHYLDCDDSKPFIGTSLIDGLDFASWRRRLKENWAAGFSSRPKFSAKSRQHELYNPWKRVVKIWR